MQSGQYFLKTREGVLLTRNRGSGQRISAYPVQVSGALLIRQKHAVNGFAMWGYWHALLV